MKIAMTGASGLVGARLVELLKNDFEFIPFTHNILDITNAEQVRATLMQQEYDIFLHLAAYTNVDNAEKEQKSAHALNVIGTQHLFNTTKEKGKPFIYFSTDFVFDGGHQIYTEESTPHPIGYYGQSKWEGEKVLNHNATIIRISYPYGNSPSPKPDFVKRIKSLLEQGIELRMITDGSMTPTYIDDIALALQHILKNPKAETYHIVGSQSVSPFESGQLIAKRFGFSPDLVKPTTYAEYMKGRAPRPQYSTIKSIKNTFYPMRSFEEGLKSIA